MAGRGPEPDFLWWRRAFYPGEQGLGYGVRAPSDAGTPPATPSRTKRRQAEPQQCYSGTPQSHDETLNAVERIAGLQAKGTLSDEEFGSQKAELLARLQEKRSLRSRLISWQLPALCWLGQSHTS